MFFISSKHPLISLLINGYLLEHTKNLKEHTLDDFSSVWIYYP